MVADIIVAVMVTAFALFGLKSGFVRMVSRVLCLFVSIFAAKFIYPYVSAFVGNSFVGDAIYGYVSDKAGASALDDMPSFIKSAGEYTVNGIYSLCVDAVTVVALILIVYMVARVLSASFNVFSKLPVISFFNGAAGLAAGLAFGLAVSYIFVTVITLTDVAGSAAWMENSAIAGAMFEKNFIINFVTRLN